MYVQAGRDKKSKQKSVNLQLLRVRITIGGCHVLCKLAAGDDTADGTVSKSGGTVSGNSCVDTVGCF